MAEIRQGEWPVSCFKVGRVDLVKDRQSLCGCVAQRTRPGGSGASRTAKVSRDRDPMTAVDLLR